MKGPPPGWLPWLGPPLAGIGAGLTGALLHAGFWPALAGALVLGSVPTIVYRLWKRAHDRNV
jgi:hypothetical protein